MSKQYYITNQSGEVIRQGVCPDETFDSQAQEGETLHEGTVEVPSSPWFDDTNYRNVRATKYPPVGEQLDAIYKMAKSLVERGVTLPDEVVSWMDSVGAVKEQFPK